MNVTWTSAMLAIITQPVIIPPIIIRQVIEAHQASYDQVPLVNTPSQLRANIFKQKNRFFWRIGVF